MLDRSIPFYNTILRCDDYNIQPVKLPEGYAIVSYQPGYEDDWARLEYEVGDFDSQKEAKQYFISTYLNHSKTDQILFLVNSRCQVIGSCIAWKDIQQENMVNSLHWLIVDETDQGKGLGRALCRAAMNLFFLNDQKPIYIHTQPWSYKAIFLYLSLGFRLQKHDTFGSYTNQYQEVMDTLKNIVTEEQYEKLVALSTD